jgi:hypothetical protein
MEYNIKIDIMDVGSDGLRWLKLAQNYVQLWSLVLLMLNFQSLQRSNSQLISLDI